MSSSTPDADLEFLFDPELIPADVKAQLGPDLPRLRWVPKQKLREGHHRMGGIPGAAKDPSQPSVRTRKLPNCMRTDTGPK